MSIAAQFRNVCFTVNNYPETYVARLEALVTEEKAHYVVAGKEVGESGTPHLQGYIEFTAKTTRNQARALLPGAHLEARRGTQAQAVDYCKKDGDYVEFGTSAAGGGRPKKTNKLLQFKKEIDEGSFVNLLNHPDMTFQTFKYIQASMPYLESGRNPDDPPPTVIWKYGASGTGKSRSARESAKLHDPSCDPYVKPDSSSWFDGYDGHKVAIFEDFRSSDMQYNYLLKLLDRYPMRVPIKGGFRQWKPTLIIITSPIHPKDTYQGLQSRESETDSIQQLLRRITTIEHMTL